MGILFTYLVTLLFPPGFWDRKFTVAFATTYLAATISFGSLLAIATCLGLYSFSRLSKFVGYDGREKAMSANCQLIERYLTDTSIEMRSTRVTNWRVAENSEARQKFRNLLTEKITAGYVVKRLWQIKDRDDLAQLQRYLFAYSSHDNYSVKIIVSKTVMIPELLCIGNRVASLSLPEPARPRELARCLHFHGKKEIDAVSRYFDVLWELAEPIKIANKIFLQNLEQAEAAIKS